MGEIVLLGAVAVAFSFPHCSLFTGRADQTSRPLAVAQESEKNSVSFIRGILGKAVRRDLSSAH